MSEKKKNLRMWKTAEGDLIPMEKLDEKHLQSAFNHACIKELKHFNIVNMFNDLKEQLEEVAKERGIVLEYPDREYFEKEQRTKQMSKVAVLAEREEGSLE